MSLLFAKTTQTNNTNSEEVDFLPRKIYDGARDIDFISCRYHTSKCQFNVLVITGDYGPCCVVVGVLIAGVLSASW